MGDVIEDSTTTTPAAVAVVAAPPMQTQYNSPSLSRKPLLSIEPNPNNGGANNRRSGGSTPNTTTTTAMVTTTPTRSTPNFLTPNFLTPLGSPIRRAIQMTKLDPQDAWLPITESRNGNAYYAAFHTLSSGIGIQALVVPVAFTVLGWAWGTISLTIAFIWQLYTLGLLVKLHESTDTGMRYNRYLQLFSSTFGDRMTKIFALFPILYLSGGTCVALIIIGGGTMRTFYQIVCGEGCSGKPPLTIVEWYLVFTCAAVVLSQLPNLNSIAGVSLVGAVTAIGYCTILWVIAVKEGRIDGVSYDRVRPVSNVDWIFGVLNSFGIIAFGFRGHNLTLEIQATMPSSDKKPSYVPMWRGVQIAYLIVAMCLFPLCIGGYWAYGNKIPENGGMLTAIYTYHGRDTAQSILALTSLFIIINAVSSFQIYGMQMFDDMESKYTTRFNKPCPWWLRSIFRAMFGFGCFFVGVAIPFLGSFAGLIGGIALPVTFAYPCFLWNKIRKPKKHGAIWCLNFGLGVSGMVLSVLVIAAGVYVIIDTGIKVSFFKPQ
ncbi:hypothetical protein U1Q18_006082 [Sarracenia purpurea var. burkii]